MDGIWSDLRSAARGLRKSPSFTAIAVLTLALGIGANAVVFAIVNTVLLKPLPYGDPDRLMTVVEADGQSTDPQTVSYATAQDLRRNTDVFERLSLWRDGAIRPVHHGQADQLRGMRVNADFFDTLGVRMLLGRTFTADEDTPAGSNTVILTYAIWTEQFGADPSVIGRTLPTIDGSVTVVGVLPRDFHPLHMSNPAELPRVFMPLGWDPAGPVCRAPSCRGLRAIGRLRPHVSVQQANAALKVAMQALVQSHPQYPDDTSAVVRPLRNELIGQFGTALWMLEGSVVLLLVLACANVATLLLARTIARQAELTIRAALGASRGRVVRQLLTESLLLSTIAATAGVILAILVTRFIARSSDVNIPRIGELAPDAGMLVFSIAASAITAVLFGLVPGVMASRGSFASLRNGSATPGIRSQALARTLVATELALAFVLVLMVGLLSKSYFELMHVDPGFATQHVMTLSLLPDEVHYPTPTSRLAYFDAVVSRMRVVPGVQDAAYASTLPLSHASTNVLYVREHPLPRDIDAPRLDTYLVSTNYLDVMNISLRHGRRLSRQDTATSQAVAVISESAARAAFAGDNPIGQHIQIGSHNDGHPWMTIVGIVGDVHQYGLDRSGDAAVYVPFAQVTRPSQGWASLVVRSSQPSERMESAMRATMAAVDPLQPIFHLQPMATFVALSVAQRRFSLALVSAFGVLALLLATGGVYGVVSYVVEQRTREVGIRLALGAPPSAVRWLMVREMLAVVVVAVVAGFVVASATTSGLSPLLFGVTRFDVETTLAVAGVLIAAALGASWAPVARAGRIDPLAALRAD